VASLRASVHDAGVEAAKWARLVRRHESEAARAPARYRLRVGVFATLAYAAVFAWLLLLFAVLLVVGYAVVAWGMPDLAAVKVALVAGTPLLLTLRALAVDVPAPEGIELTREGAPELFAAIGRIDAAVRGPSLAAVVLTDDLNAGVATVPRFLSFFGSRNYLVVGLPLLQAVRPDEFDAVLAHEFAHLSRRHGRLSLAVYRRVATGQQLQAALAKKTTTTHAVFRAFFGWYLPRLYAYALPLERAHELHADAIAASAVAPTRLPARSSGFASLTASSGRGTGGGSGRASGRSRRHRARYTPTSGTTCARPHATGTHSCGFATGRRRRHARQLPPDPRPAAGSTQGRADAAEGPV